MWRGFSRGSGLLINWLGKGDLTLLGGCDAKWSLADNTTFLVFVSLDTIDYYIVTILYNN